jgi:hypothetical protein
MDSQPVTGPHTPNATDLAMLCRLMFEGSPLPMLAVVGAQHIVCYANPAAFRLSDSSKDKLIGTPFGEIEYSPKWNPQP